MLFNQPIPRARQPHFSEGTALASVRDDRNNSKQWQKNDTIKDQNNAVTLALTSMQQQLNKLKRRQVGYSPQQNEVFYPFKIYQPPQSAFPATGIIQGTIFDTNANPSPINIDSSKPTNFGSSPPTVNPTTDYWRLWLVRNGQTEIRPFYSSIDSGFTGFDGNGSANNFASQREVFFGTDTITPFRAAPYNAPIGKLPKSEPGTYDSTNDDSGVGNGVFYTNGETDNSYPDQYLYSGVIVVDGTFDGLSEIFYSLWIEITPDTDDSQIPLARIKGFRFTNDPDIGYSTDVLPTFSPFIIPVGQILNFASTSNPSVVQGLNSHCFNRWSSSMFCSNTNGAPPTQTQLYTANVCGALNYRGDWQNNLVIQDQVFYPGDFVTFGSSGNVLMSGDSVIVGGTSTTILRLMATVVGFTSDPSTDPNFISLDGGATVGSIGGSITDIEG